MGVVPAGGDQHVPLADLCAVGRIAGHPLASPVLHPGVALALFLITSLGLRLRVQVTRYIPGRQADLTHQRDSEVRHVLADALALVPGFLGARLNASRAL